MARNLLLFETFAGLNDSKRAEEVIFECYSESCGSRNTGKTHRRRPVDTVFVFSAQQHVSGGSEQIAPDRIFPLKYVSAHYSHCLLSHAASVGVKSRHLRCDIRPLCAITFALVQPQSLNVDTRLRNDLPPPEIQCPAEAC